MDITIDDKGKVASVFVVGNEGGNIQMQNKVKDKARQKRETLQMYRQIFPGLYFNQHRTQKSGFLMRDKSRKTLKWRLAKICDH